MNTDQKDYTGISFKYLTGYNRVRHRGTCETVFAGRSLTELVASALLKLLRALCCSLKRCLKMYNEIILWLFMGPLPSKSSKGGSACLTCNRQMKDAGVMG